MRIAWVARDGYSDLFPMIERRLAEQLSIESFFLCHTRDQAELLEQGHRIGNVTVIAKAVSAVAKVEDPAAELEVYARKYQAAPVIRCLWSTMFEMSISEDELAKQALAHFKFWEAFLTRHQIDVLIYERPSILSSCIAWIVCQGLGIDSIDFVDTAVDTMTITSNWRGDYAEELEERLNSGIDEESVSYARAVAYVDRMLTRPTKTNEAILAGELSDRRAEVSVRKIVNVLRRITEHSAKTEYFMYRNFLPGQLSRAAKYITRYNLHRLFPVFDRQLDPSREKYFLFPLFMSGEWSNHVFMSLGYWDQVGTVRHIAQCLPVGSFLYVKEHRSMFAEHSFRFYREIKRIRNVRLVSPFEDTFGLIRNAQAVVTLGSTMGFEAILMGTPVLLMGEPWYRVFPGLRRIDTPYQMAYYMQHLDEIERLSRTEAIKLAYTLFDISFDAVKIPRPGTLSDENVGNFVNALLKYLPQAASSPCPARVRS